MDKSLKNQVIEILEEEQVALNGALDNPSDVKAPEFVEKTSITQNSDGTWNKVTTSEESKLFDGNADENNRKNVKGKAEKLQLFCKQIDNKILEFNREIDVKKDLIVDLSVEAGNGNCWPGIAYSTLLPGSDIRNTLSPSTSSLASPVTLNKEIESIKIYPKMAGPNLDASTDNPFEPDTVYTLTSEYAGYGYQNLRDSRYYKTNNGSLTGVSTDGSGAGIGSARFDVSLIQGDHEAKPVAISTSFGSYYAGAGVIAPLGDATDDTVTPARCVAIASSISTIYDEILEIRKKRDSLRSDLNTIKDNKSQKELASWGISRMENESTRRNSSNSSAIAAVKTFADDGSVNITGYVLNLDASNENSYSGVGTSWEDLSGNENHATLFPTGSPAEYEYSDDGFLTFNGTDEYSDTISNQLEITTTDHGISEWYCFEDTSVLYSAIYPSTEIYEVLHNGAKLGIVTTGAGGPANGSFNALQGRRYYGTKAIHFIGNDASPGAQHKIAPVSFAGTTFGSILTRYSPGTFKIYAPTGAEVEFFNNVATGINGAATSSETVGVGSTAVFTFTAGVSDFQFLKSDRPIVATSTGSGGDNVILAPASKIIYRRRDQHETSVYNTTPTGITTNCVYDDEGQLVVAFEVGDGAGGDTAQAIGKEYLSDTYSWGEELSDYYIIAPYGGTEVSVSYWDGSEWQLGETHTFSPSGISTLPATAFREGSTGFGADGNIGDDDGTASYLGGGATIWKFEGTQPFALYINDTEDDEETLLGWMSNKYQRNAGFFNPNEDWTIETWFKINGAPSENTSANLIVDVNASEETTHSLLVSYGTGGDFAGITTHRLAYMSKQTYNGAFDSVVGETTISDGVWYHGVVTKNDSFVRLYLNGNLDAEFTGTIRATNQDFVRVARYTDTDSYSNVSVSAVNVYEKAYNTEEVSILFNKKKTQFGSLG